MSLHPSLSPTKGKKHRSVLKRYERIEALKKDEKWTDNKSPFGLPKSRIIKIKLKKVKAAKDEKAVDAKAADNKAATTPTKPA